MPEIAQIILYLSFLIETVNKKIIFKTRERRGVRIREKNVQIITEQSD